MSILKTRPYLGESDRKAIAEFVNACEPIGQIDKDTSICELQQQIDSPWVDKSRDLHIWEGEDGQLKGFGHLYIPDTKNVLDGYLWFCVESKEYNLESEIINWSEKRLREAGQERNLPAKLRFSTRNDKRDRISLLEHHRFKIDRQFLTMSRSLKDIIPSSQLPPGFSLYEITSNSNLSAWVDMFNQSFIDHWNHHELTVKTFKHWLKDTNYNPALNIVALSPDRQYAAFCYAQINEQENKLSGRKEGWIQWLGTSRNFRKLGLGKAILLEGLHRLQLAGMETVKLAVDADSLTGANRLYKSVGFRPVENWLEYVKDVA